MADMDIIFSRHLLSMIVGKVKKAGYRVNKDAWVWKAGEGHYEFHGPDGYWDGAVSASNAYEAKYKGWSDFLNLE